MSPGTGQGQSVYFVKSQTTLAVPGAHFRPHCYRFRINCRRYGRIKVVAGMVKLKTSGLRRWNYYWIAGFIISSSLTCHLYNQLIFNNLLLLRIQVYCMSFMDRLEKIDSRLILRVLGIGILAYIVRRSRLAGCVCRWQGCPSCDCRWGCPLGCQLWPR